LAFGESGAELLPGENPNTASPEDSEHWLGVYEELLATVDSVLANEKLPAGDVNRTLLEQIRLKYLHRIEWWREHL
jgi:hypothetical protein